jgi:hypothetical protein
VRVNEPEAPWWSPFSRLHGQQGYVLNTDEGWYSWHGSDGPQHIYRVSLDGHEKHQMLGEEHLELSAGIYRWRNPDGGIEEFRYIVTHTEAEGPEDFQMRHAHDSLMWIEPRGEWQWWRMVAGGECETCHVEAIWHEGEPEGYWTCPNDHGHVEPRDPPKEVMDRFLPMADIYNK